jgi:Leucine-rich repeat (LRR) protein
LSSNNLKIYPPELKDLYSLKELNLSNNLIKYLDILMFIKNNKLETLDLSYNKIKIIPDEI